MSRDPKDDVRFRVIQLIENDPEISQREISSRLGISLGSANYCVRALAEKGLVKIRNFRAADNKLRYAYILTPKGLTAKARMTRGFLERKRAEFAALKAEIDALERDIGVQSGVRADLAE